MRRRSGRGAQRYRHVHNLLSGRARHPVLSVAGLLVLMMGILLSFSRGSWGATIVR
jgi:hypothetical protein